MFQGFGFFVFYPSLGTSYQLNFDLKEVLTYDLHHCFYENRALK